MRIVLRLPHSLSVMSSVASFVLVCGLKKTGRLLATSLINHIPVCRIEFQDLPKMLRMQDHLSVSDNPCT
jgi:hypothetical protein